MGAVADARGQDLGALCAGEEQELFALMRGDIDEDAAIALPLKKPCGTGRSAHAVRAEAGGRDDLADRACRHQFAGLYRRTVFEMLGIENGEDPPGFLLHPADFRQLIERRHARLVGHHILAGAHGGNGDCSAIGRDGGCDDQVDLRVVIGAAGIIIAGG